MITYTTLKFSYAYSPFRDTEWGKRPTNDGNPDIPDKEKEKPSFEPSGKLAEDTNTYKGVVIKYNEPPEAKLPKIRWRLYPFKVSSVISSNNFNVLMKIIEINISDL